jgi:hypothetical protein
MRQTILAGITVVVIGCGGGDSDGEPIAGTIEFMVGAETIRPTAGAALQLDGTPPDQMIILIATSEARCGIDGTGDPPDWFSQTTVNNEGPATWQTAVALLHIAGEEDSYSSSGPGTVVIDSIGPERITGSIDYTGTDVQPVARISGTFDIIRCF